MFHSILASLALVVGLSSAIPSATRPAGLIPRQETAKLSSNLIVAGAGKIMGFGFNGSFVASGATANISEPGKTASWMIFKEPHHLYAVDENSAAIRLFNYVPANGTLSNEVASFNGSSGVVHLAFNMDKSKLIGSSYGQGQVDVWDVANSDGHLTLAKQISLPGNHGPNFESQTQHRAHQAVLDPSGRFFLINDLGGDALHLVDTKNGSYSIVKSVPVIPAGSGPRHGAFISINGTYATHYVVACEMTSTLQLFTVSYDNDSLTFTGTHTIPSYDPNHAPANISTAAAGELIVSRNGPAHVYVTNRRTGDAADNIAHFTLEAKSTTDPTAQLVYKGSIGTGGIAPRMATFSSELKQETLFVANTIGDSGLVAMKRESNSGKLIFDRNDATRQVSNSFFSPGLLGNAVSGPQFILAF